MLWPLNSVPTVVFMDDFRRVGWQKDAILGELFLAVVD